MFVIVKIDSPIGAVKKGSWLTGWQLANRDNLGKSLLALIAYVPSCARAARNGALET
jgi:hypothetical protein